jgi:hypothetical protein
VPDQPVERAQRASSPRETGTVDDAAGTRTPASVRALRRPGNLRSADALTKIAMVCFAVGTVAIFADMVLFASGSRDLPLWLNLLALLAPIGFGLGLLAVFLQARRARRARAN